MFSVNSVGYVNEGYESSVRFYPHIMQSVTRHISLN